eukprot:364542-Amphidinium_carterae.1
MSSPRVLFSELVKRRPRTLEELGHSMPRSGYSEREVWGFELSGRAAGGYSPTRLQQFHSAVRDVRQSAAPVELYLLRFSGAADLHASAGRLLTDFSSVGAEAPLSAVLASEATAPVVEEDGAFPLLLASQNGHAEC